MGWIAIRMLTGDRVKFIGLLFGIGFSTLLITQQLTIFVNLLFRGGTAVEAVSTANVWVMDPVEPDDRHRHRPCRPPRSTGCAACRASRGRCRRSAPTPWCKHGRRARWRR